MDVLDTGGQLLKVEKEYQEIKAKAFWIMFLSGLKEEKDKSIDHCIKDREDIRFYQGQIRMLDSILALPDKIIKALRDKVKK